MHRTIALVLLMFSLLTAALGQEVRITLLGKTDKNSELRPDSANFLLIAPLPPRATVSCTRGDLKAIGDGQFILKIPGANIYQRVAVAVEHEGNIVAIKNFGVRTSGSEVRVAGIRGDTMAAAVLIGNPIVSVFLDDIECEVKRFAVYIFPKRGEFLGTLQIEGHAITGEALQYIKRCKGGDRIYIEDVETSCTDTRSIPPLSVAIALTR